MSMKAIREALLEYESCAASLGAGGHGEVLKRALAEVEAIEKAALGIAHLDADAYVSAVDNGDDDEPEVVARAQAESLMRAIADEAAKR